MNNRQVLSKGNVIYSGIDLRSTSKREQGSRKAQMRYACINP